MDGSSFLMMTWWKRPWSIIRWRWRAVILFVVNHCRPGYIATVTGSAMHFRGTSNMLVVILDATIESGLIVHAVPGSGCVVPVMFDMFWRSRSMVTESV